MDRVAYDLVLIQNHHTFPIFPRRSSHLDKNLSFARAPPLLPQYTYGIP